MRLIDSKQMFPAKLAAILAQELGLPLGNMWEPGICRSIQKHLADGLTEEEITLGLRFSLGLERVDKCDE